MSLDVSKLGTDLTNVFTHGKEATSSDEVAQALAQAIHAYVSAATVDGVVVKVVDPNGQALGTGTQAAPVLIT